MEITIEKGTPREERLYGELIMKEDGTQVFRFEAKVEGLPGVVGVQRV